MRASQTVVGEQSGNDYVFNFRSVEPNSEGGTSGSSENPFNVPDKGPLPRIERRQEQMEAQLTAMQEQLGTLTGAIDSLASSDRPPPSSGPQRSGLLTPLH